LDNDEIASKPTVNSSAQVEWFARCVFCFCIYTACGRFSALLTCSTSQTPFFCCYVTALF
jgi:succinate dehydrogenase/fumarate reductase-like Fe-S protein